MPGSRKTLRVYRDSWVPEHVAILCGIANAGGGVMTVASMNKNYSKGLKRMRRSFEQIPQIVQQELGIVCTTQPVLEGPTLCLEIDVPPSDPDKPIRYRGAYRFFDITTDSNLSISVEEIRKRRAKTAPVKPQQGFSDRGAAIAPAEPDAVEPAAQDTSLDNSRANDLFLLFSQLATQFEQMGGDVVIDREESSVTFAFPRQASDAGLKEGASVDAQAQRRPEAPVRHVDPNAELFAERSVAAANGLNLTSTDEYVLRALNTNGRATAARIAEVLGVSESTVRRSFKRLKELRLIMRVGSAKAGYWRVNN